MGVQAEGDAPVEGLGGLGGAEDKTILGLELPTLINIASTQKNVKTDAINVKKSLKFSRSLIARFKIAAKTGIKILKRIKILGTTV